MPFDLHFVGLPDADIRQVDALPSTVADGADAGPNSRARPGTLYFDIPGTASFLIEQGRSIAFAIHDGADPDLVALFLHGTARAALIHMRGELPLHAATYVPPDGGPALAICGAGGAGKSTLGAQLSQRGWTLVADDVTRVTENGAELLAWPSRPAIKLWQDACAMAGLDVSRLQRVCRGYDKFYVPVPATATPVRLGSIVELVDGDALVDLSIGARMALISRHAFRPAQIGPLGMSAAHARIVAATVTRSRQLQLPGKARYNPTALADLIERTLAETRAR